MAVSGPEGTLPVAEPRDDPVEPAPPDDRSRTIDELVHEQLVAAVGTREVIGQAQGILMAREHRTRSGAFELLRVKSQRTNRKLRDVAADLVAEAEEEATA